MKLQELKTYSEKNNIRLSSSEETELLNKDNENDFYNYLRDLGYYRVFETYFKDPYYQTLDFYCTGFLNSEDGYNWLICVSSENEYDEKDFDKMIFDLYIVTKNNTRYERKDKKVMTGTANELLEYSKKKDKEGYKIAYRHNEIPKLV